VLDARQRARASRERVFLERSVLSRPGGSGSWPVPSPPAETELLVAVGTPLEGSERAAHRLELALAVGLPVLAGLVVLGRLAPVGGPCWRRSGR